VVHVGCGVGYYTAIIAELTGPSGRVTGIEIDPDLAERARVNLADRPWVDVVTGDASAVPPAAAIFINAGCTHPRSEWLDALDEGGRLVFPLTASIEGATGPGVMLKIRRAGGAWPVEVVSAVGIFDCAGARDPEENQLLLEYARRGYRATESFRALRRDPHDHGPTCMVHTKRYCLSSG
jgi:protein-L-isoaspartate(D-aspartate) O-methyltransferase